MRRLELLSPAGNADIAIEAVKHGADAVYIGPPAHGARKSASNSLDDIKRVVEFAHIFNTKVYVTVNTIIYENELREVERMIRNLYLVGVDALIVQDMGILRMDIPPIALHASTQCDIRTVEKARFLEEVGFSQIVLARELSLRQINEICKAVSIPVETFVHGALCVSYSGRCSAGFACAGRSGNRGECPQICRQAFTLKDADGKILSKDKYLLSLKDFRTDHLLHELVEAGVSSFKIEGRLKEAGYVKNVTAAYSRKLNEIIASSEGKYQRSSYGQSEIAFEPKLDRSFNRGFTTYLLTGKPDKGGMGAIDTPKSLGEKINNPMALRPGDGISYFDDKGNYCGVLVNGIKNGKIIGNKPIMLPPGTELRRTSSVEWKKTMNSETGKRKLDLSLSLDAKGLTAEDESGSMVRLGHGLPEEKATKPTDYGKTFEKLGNTPFRLKEFINSVPDNFYPLSALTSLKRDVVEALLKQKRATYTFDYRRKENIDYHYPSKTLDYRDNVANSLAERFYREHGVTKIERALETWKGGNLKGKTVMTTKQCILRELGLCLKKNNKIKMPLSLESGKLKFQPEFDCKSCEMHLNSLPIST